MAFLTGLRRLVVSTRYTHLIHQPPSTSRNFSKFTKLKKHDFNKLVIPTGVGIGIAYYFATNESAGSAWKTLGIVQAASPVYNAAERSSVSRTHNFIADIVEKAAPAVVYIEIRGRNPFSGNVSPMSNGSGFIVREDGIILTNAHVIANRQNVQVRLHDGRVFDGHVQAVDPVSDLATVKIDTKNLPILKLGKSKNVRPGEWVIAMGSPLSLSNTVTAGIISSVNRGSQELGIHNKDMEYIQTDAVINFGNSGGPLVNLDGEAIGINTMKVTTGISFAIPAEYAVNFLEKVKDVTSRTESKGWFGSAKPLKRRFLGITMLTLTPSIIMELKDRAANFPRKVEYGVFITRILVGSPAYNAGLQPGDIITSINGKQVKAASDVYSALEKGETLKTTILRKDQEKTINISPENVE
ncbi:hypothetical protein ScPMuIL_006221 [Solemya velum]